MTYQSKVLPVISDLGERSALHAPQIIPRANQVVPERIFPGPSIDVSLIVDIASVRTLTQFAMSSVNRVAVSSPPLGRRRASGAGL